MLPGLSAVGGLGGFSTSKVNPVSGGKNQSDFGDVRTGGLRVGGMDWEELIPIIALAGALVLVGLYILKKA